MNDQTATISDSPPPRQTWLTRLAQYPELERFRGELERQRRSAHTVRNYVQDVSRFARWFLGTHGRETFQAKAVTPIDLEDYRSYLQAVQRAKPATINRKLIALRQFFEWAKATGRLRTKTAELPTKTIRPVKAQAQGPKWLTPKEVRALIRTVQEHGTTRDEAILQLLRNTGIRVSELTSLKLADLETSERKGQLTVWGKGEKQRVIPLNVTVRNALDGYLAVRPKVTSDRLFLGQRRPLTPKGIVLLVKRYAYLAGLTDVTPTPCATALPSTLWTRAKAWSRSSSSWDTPGWRQRRSIPSQGPRT